MAYNVIINGRLNDRMYPCTKTGTNISKVRIGIQLRENTNSVNNKGYTLVPINSLSIKIR